MTGAGSALEGGGFILDATGIGAVIGVPANVAGAAMIAGGASIGAISSANFAKDTNQMFAKVHEGTDSASGGSAGTESAADGTGELVQKTNSISKNIENLRNWSQSKGWVRQDTAGGVEQWGVRNSDGQFNWRLKIKPQPSNRPGLGAGSQQPRFDARLDDGQYINPYTGEIGGRDVGTHIPLG